MAKSEKLVQEIASYGEEYNTYLEKLDSKVKHRVQVYTNKVKNGLHSVVPLYCKGPENCTFIEKCPIPTRTESGELVFGDKSQYPIGYDCVMESIYARQKVIEYIQYLDIDGSDPFEMAIANELAALDVYTMRARHILSLGDRNNEGLDFLRIDHAFSEKTGGIVGSSTQVHPVIDVIDRFEKRRGILMDKLMVTREAKVKMKKVSTEEQIRSLLGAKVDALLEALNSIQNKEIALDEIEVK